MLRPRSERDSAIRVAICTSPIMHLICSPKFCITFVFHFSWVLQPSEEKLKTMLMQNFGGQIRRILRDDLQVAYAWQKVPERREKPSPRDHGLFRMYELNISCPNIWGRFQVCWLFSSLTEKSSSAAILEFPFYVRWLGRALPTNLTCDVTSWLVDWDWKRGFLETRNNVVQWSNLQTNLETKLIKWCILLHLLLFITRKYAFICVKRRPAARRYIH